MALPPHHPFWAALLVTLAVAVLSSALVYARADRIVSGMTAAEFERRRLRRVASRGIAGSALLFGAAGSGLFIALQTHRPDLAVGLFHVASVAAAVLLSAAAVRLRVRAGLRGVPELVALNLLWATAFGWVMPELARPRVDFTQPTLVQSFPSTMTRSGGAAPSLPQE
jgi:hypothetical protein